MTKVVLTPDAVTLAPGATQQFAVSATMSNGTTNAAPSVRWVITGGWISNGLYTAGTSTGAFRVILSSVDGPADTSSVTIATGPPPPPPPTLTFTASPTTITTGQPSTLTWASTNATVCTASNGWTGAQSLSGTLQAIPTATTTYTLACTGAGGTISRSATVTVNLPPAPTLTFTVLPTTITAGQTSTLSWSSTNATSCTASNGWTGIQAVSGTLVVSPAATTTYTLACTGLGGTVTQSATGTVNAPPAPTLAISAAPLTITAGQTSTLTWTSTNTVVCTAINGWTGTQLVSGTLVVGPTVTTTYTLGCTGPGGTITQSVTVTVNPAPAPTLSFTASPTTITSGQSSTLSWGSTGATSCTASDGWSGTQLVSGSLIVSPAATVTYTLTCSGAGGAITRSAMVTVNAPPPPTLTFTAIPTAITTGQSSLLSWTSTNATSCTASDGWSGTQTVSGTLAVSPTATATYTLGCTGPGGTITQSATVTVTPPMPTLGFTALPTAIASGSSSTLSWTSANAAGCLASDGWSGIQAVTGSVPVSPTATTIYTLTCSGAGGTIAKSATVTVTPPPAPTLTFTALPTTIIVGQGSTLSWTSTNATSCTASDGWTGSQPVSGTLAVTPAATTIYSLGCTGLGGTVTQSATVTVTPPPAPTLSFTALPVSIIVGQTSTLSWTSVNATSCTATDGWTGTQSLSGTLVVTPAATTGYTLECTGAGGTISQSATVTVNPVPAPTLALAAVPSAIAVGQSSTLSWTSTNATSCTATDGWNGAQQPTGTLAVSPAVTTTYTLTCTGAGGTIGQSATVTVSSPAPTVTLTAAPTSITTGQSSTLTWSTVNAASCSASNGWTGAQPTSGTLVVTPGATTTYTLACTGGGGTTTQSAIVTVNPPTPPTLTLNATPSTITTGQGSTLSWTSTDATSCSATGGWLGAQATTGTMIVSPTVTTTYGLDCIGLGGTATQSATVTVTAPPPPPPPPGGYVYPIRLGPTNRYMVDQTGKPFLMVGEAAWSLIAQLTDADADLYFAARAAQGFNVAMINLIEHKFSAAAPKNAYGQAPFTGKVFATPNDAYFSHVDAVINSAASHGIIVMLDVMYLGASCSNEGWCAEVKAATTAEMTTYGAYIGNRYRNYDNIIWQIGGDTDPTVVASKLTAMINGILSADTRHPFVAHNGSWQNGVDPWGNVSWLTMNDVYTYSNTLYSNMLAAYNRTPIMPVFLIEAKYENETEWNVTQQQLRSQFYWTVLSGGFGQVYGNCPVWNFDAPGHGAYCPQTGWKAQLTSQGAKNMQFGAQLIGARHWWALVPDASHLVMTAGYASGTTYATAAYASDGSTALAYLPTSRAVTVTGSRLTGNNMTVSWYNPATGVSTQLGSFPTAGSRSFTPPAAGDWVLVMDAQ